MQLNWQHHSDTYFPHIGGLFLFFVILELSLSSNSVGSGHMGSAAVWPLAGHTLISTVSQDRKPFKPHSMMSYNYTNRAVLTSNIKIPRRGTPTGRSEEPGGRR